MGKHNTNNTTGAKRSRAGRQEVAPGHKRRGSMVAAKTPRKTAVKLEKRQASYDGLPLIKKLATTRPGSQKQRTN